MTDHWRVAIDKGKVTVEHEDAAADTVLSQDRATLVDAIEGSENILISVMLGRIGIVGDAERMVRFQRLFGQQPEMATTATGGGSHG